MTYVATVNVPGYLPVDDAPAMFDTASEAWAYLADERETDETDASDGDSQLSPTWVSLRDRARTTEVLVGEDGTGTVSGPTPGYDGSHDLGLAYCVTLVEA